MNADVGQTVAALLSSLSGAKARVECMCVWCLEDIDPQGELSCYRAPDNGECWKCGDPRRERDGFVFVLSPLRVPESSPR